MGTYSSTRVPGVLLEYVLEYVLEYLLEYVLEYLLQYGYVWVSMAISTHPWVCTGTRVLT